MRGGQFLCKQSTIQAPRTVFIITGDVRRNSRAIRQIRALSNAGFHIRVLALDSKPVDRARTTPKSSTTAGSAKSIPAEITWIDTQQESGPRFFWRWHRNLTRHLAPLTADIYHASDLYALPAALNAARRQDAKCSYDAREIYSHVAATAGRPWVSVFWRQVERYYATRCDHVFTVSPSIADYLSEAYRIPRPTLVENVPEIHVPPARDVGRRKIRRRLNLDGNDAIVLHQGQIREHRGCEVLVKALPSTPAHVHVVFLGYGPLQNRLRDLATRLNVIDRVHFQDFVPPDDLLSWTVGADVGVTLLEDVCLNHRFALPNKLFEYLAAGLPVLGSDLPEIRRIITSFDVGRLCLPGNPVDTAAQLNLMLEDPASLSRWSINSRRVFETINWQSASQRLVDAFTSLVHN